MPTYQYACRSCDHRFEVVQGFDEAALTTCPACQQEQLRKLFGNVGVVFKGSGFYRNDSRSGKSAKTAGAAPAPNGSTSAGSTSGDSGASSAGAKTAGGGAEKSGGSDSGGSGKPAASKSAN